MSDEDSNIELMFTIMGATIEHSPVTDDKLRSMIEVLKAQQMRLGVLQAHCASLITRCEDKMSIGEHK